MTMNRSEFLLWALAAIAGLILVPIRLVLAFFPFFNVTEVVLFAGLCLLLALLFKPRSWLWALVVAGPTCVLVARMLFRLGADNVMHGIGTGHAVSLVLIPVSACFGAWLGKRASKANAPSWQ